MTMSNVRKHVTPRIDAAATLMCLNHTLLGITPLTDRICNFVFEADAAADEERYERDEIRLSPRTFFAVLAELKRRIHVVRGGAR